MNKLGFKDIYRIAFDFGKQASTRSLLGTSTTGISAPKLGRRFIGIESDADVMKIAKAHMIKSLNGNCRP